jgi:hypothetical protein
MTRSGSRTPAPSELRPITEAYPLNHGLPATVGKFLYHLVKLQLATRTQKISSKILAVSCEDSTELASGNDLTTSQLGGIASRLQAHSWDTDTRPYILGKKNSRQNGYTAEGFATDPLTIRLAFELFKVLKPEYESLIRKTEFITEFQKRNHEGMQMLDRGRSDIDKSLLFLKKHQYIDIVTDHGADDIRRLDRLAYEKEYLSRAEKLFPPSTQPAIISMGSTLDPYRRVFHHYHLTLNKRGKPTWIYKTLDFTRSESKDSISTTAAILPEPGERGEDNQYIFRASLDGPHLIVWSHRERGGNSDIGVEVYPRVEAIANDPDLFQSFCGARINQTWDGTTVASSIAILSIKPIVDAVGNGPLDDSCASRLEEEWENHIKTQPQIVRLPSAYPARYSHFMDISGRWYYEVHSIGGAFSHSGECRIFYNHGNHWITGERIFMRTQSARREVVAARSLWDSEWCEFCRDGQLRFIYHIDVREPHVVTHLRGLCEVRVSSADKLTGTYHLLPPFDPELLNAQSGTIDFKRIDEASAVEPPIGYILIEEE